MRLFIIFSLILFVGMVRTYGITTDISKTHQEGTGQTNDEDLVKIFYDLLSTHPEKYKGALSYIEENWSSQFIPPCIEMLVLVDRPPVKTAILDLLKKHTGKAFGSSPYDWFHWLWNQEIPLPSFYAELKARIYRNIDPRFAMYFSGRSDLATIRWDEILWGGVRQDGIPPLRDPDLLEAGDAKYMFKDDIVFGVVLNGIAKAYPKRILGWHEMVVDNFGPTRIAGVYCTLCGTMIAYNTEYKDKQFTLGTSGFLYRSNKLMYDRGTHSLWNTIEGKPVVGPLVNADIQLQTIPVITTTWGAWKKAHPTTKILSTKTGYSRNYSSGAAYRAYYATDDLMFPVPLQDKRLKNKDEVIVLRTPDYEENPIAISVDFLKKKPIYQDKIGSTPFVAITRRKGGTRIYEAKNYIFKKAGEDTVTDQKNQIWKMNENALVNDLGQRLQRLSSHNIFWFAWYNSYPDTRLIK